MKSPAHLVALYIQDKTSNQLGVNMFVNSKPTAPLDCITIYDTGGLGTSYINGECDSEPKIQIRSRASSQVTATAALYTLRDAVLPLSGNKVSGDGLYAWLSSGIFNLGRDENNAFIFTDNYKLKVVRNA